MHGKILKIQVSTKLLYWPFCLKKYHNLRIILDKLNISSLDYTVSEDLKVLLQMVGKQIATSKHPFPYCMITSPDIQKLIIII